MMREFRYDHVAREFEEGLEKEMLQHEAEKRAKKESEREERHGLQRISEDKSPLDEVRALIDASRHKSAEDEVAEHRVRAKLAALREGQVAAVDKFIGKNG